MIPESQTALGTFTANREWANGGTNVQRCQTVSTLRLFIIVKNTIDRPGSTHVCNYVTYRNKPYRERTQLASCVILEVDSKEVRCGE